MYKNKQLGSIACLLTWDNACIISKELRIRFASVAVKFLEMLRVLVPGL